MMSRLRLAAQDKIESRFSAPPPASLTPTGSVLEALMLGENGRLDAPTLHRLQASGLYHLFAISGAHIAILSLMIYAFLRLIRLRRRISHLVLISALIAYAMFVEGRPSVFRATLMALVYLAGRLLWRDAPPLNSAAFSGLVLLLDNPFSLFDIGFQLTFAATLSIILFAPRLIRLLPRLPLRAGEMTAVSTAALAGVLPLVARHFNRVTFSSIPLNLPAVPLVAAIMLAGFLFIPLSFIAPFAAGLAASLLEILIPLFLRLSGTLGTTAPFSYRIPTPGWPVLLGYGVGLGLLLVPFRKRRVRAAARSVSAVFSILLVVHPFPARSRDLRMTLIDVGQGESILIEFPGKRRMLVDGGGLHDDSFDLGENVVSPFLWRRGIRRIDILVLSHPHPDHLNGLVSVARNFKIGEFWEAFPPEQGAVYARLEKALVKSRRRRVFRGAGETAGEARIDVLHPDERDRETSLSENDLSLVLKIVYGETAFLLTGDIGRAAEERLAGGEADLSATVLKSPHHGSRTSSSAAFIEKVRPAVAVISVGRDNNFGLPNREVLETYETADIRVFRTDIHGAVEIISDGREIRIRTSRAGIPAL
jgi:competence protein ComEC